MSDSELPTNVGAMPPAVARRRTFAIIAHPDASVTFGLRGAAGFPSSGNGRKVATSIAEMQQWE